MVHSRAQHSYSHWLVRLHPETLQVTHISAGPVLRSSWFALEGHVRGVLVVGSFHVLWSSGELVSLSGPRMHQAKLAEVETSSGSCCIVIQIEMLVSLS